MEENTIEPLKEIIKQAVSKGFLVAVWKSTANLNKALAGKTDLDLLIEKNKYRDFKLLLEKKGWLRFKTEKWREVNGAESWFKYSSNCFFHLHLHTELRVGARRFKNIRINIEEEILKNTLVRDKIPLISPEVELLIYSLRKVNKHLMLENLIKHFLPSYKKQQDEELLYLQKNVDKDIFKKRSLSSPFSLMPAEFWNLVLTFSSFYKLSLREIFYYNLLLTPLWEKNIFQYCLISFKRVFLRRIEGIGKRTQPKGIIVGIVGADGSGKSTLAKGLKEKLSANFYVKNYYLGSSLAKLGILRLLYRALVFPFYSVLWRVLKAFKLDSLTRKVKGAFYDLEHILSAKQKVSYYKRAIKDKEKGAFVICDRWPIFDGYGDRVPNNVFFNKTILWLKSIYQEIKYPDILVYLEVNEKESIKRKAKHSLDVIREKTRAFALFFQEAKVPFLKLPLESSTNERVEKVISYIWRKLKDDN